METAPGFEGGRGKKGINTRGFNLGQGVLNCGKRSKCRRGNKATKKKGT